MKINKYTHIFFLIPILILAFLIRIFSLNWDQNSHLHPDERMIVMVSQGIHLPFFSQNSTLDQKISQFFSVDSPLNPKFFAYGSFSIYLLKGFSFVLSYFDPEFLGYDKITLLGRIISALFDSFTVLLVFKITELLFSSKKKGILASIIYCFSILPIQLSHFYAVDTILTFFIFFTLYYSLRFYLKRNLKNACLVGVGFGLSLATKASAVVVFLPIGMAFVVDIFLSFKKDLLNRKFNFFKKIFCFESWKTDRKKSIESIVLFFSFVILVAIVTFIIFEPYALFDFSNFWRQISEQKIMTRDAFIFPYTLQYVNTFSYFYQLKNIFLWGLGPSFGILSFVGLIFTFFYLGKGLFTVGNEESEGKQLIIFSFFIVYFYVVGAFAVKFMRYCLPIYPILAIFISNFIFYIKSKYSEKIFLVNSIFGLFFIGHLFYFFAFLNIYKTPNTRVLATEWMNKNIPVGSLILREHWDDGLPLGYGSNFRLADLPLYNSDNDPEKWVSINEQLKQGDYIIIASNRLYTPLQKLTDCKILPEDKCYLKTAQYYKDLFSGQLGFTKVAEFENYPNIFGVKINDQSSDESFTVYDHPKVMIFKKNETK